MLLLEENNGPLTYVLINLDGTKDAPGKLKTGQEFTDTGGQKGRKTQQKHVSEIKQVRNDHVACVQLLEKYDTVQKRVETGASRGNETKPPPSVILGTELLVAHEDGYFTCGD